MANGWLQIECLAFYVPRLLWDYSIGETGPLISCAHIFTQLSDVLIDKCGII